MALGGVAMHDFREYRARQLDVPRLEARLTELVQHYPALRTCIDVQRGTQHVRPEVTLHLDRHDLRALDGAAAQRQSNSCASVTPTSATIRANRCGASP